MEPKSPKPSHKRLRNVAKEKRHNFILLCAGLGISLATLLVSIVWYIVSHSEDVIGLGILISFSIAFITLAVFDGMNSIDQLIKGYDIDISKEPDHKKG